MIFKKKTLSCTNQPMKSVSWLIVSIHPLWNLSYLHPYSIAQTPMLKSSVDWIETVSCSSVTELSSASPEPTAIPFRYKCINNPNLRGADDDETTPLSALLHWKRRNTSPISAPWKLQMPSSSPHLCWVSRFQTELGNVLVVQCVFLNVEEHWRCLDIYIPNPRLEICNVCILDNNNQTW